MQGMIKRGEEFVNPMKGKKHSRKTLIKMSMAHKGIPLTDSHKNNIRITKYGNMNPAWKGALVSKRGLHLWVRKYFPKPEFCADCKINPPLDLANISQEYKRDLSDWEWLCRKCHITKDGRLKKLHEISAKNLLIRDEKGRIKNVIKGGG